MTHPTRRAAQDVILTLVKLFPLAFTAGRWKPHKPLKIGIHVDLIAAGVLSRHEVRAALRSYTTRRMYLAAVAAGGARVDLNGNSAGEVSAAEAAWAQQRLDKINVASESAAVEAVTRQAKHKAAPPPTPVQRDGIAALRAAAAARRAVAVAESRDKLIA
jgi:ProP effector